MHTTLVAKRWQEPRNFQPSLLWLSTYFLCCMRNCQSGIFWTERCFSYNGRKVSSLQKGGSISVYHFYCNDLRRMLEPFLHLIMGNQFELLFWASPGSSMGRQRLQKEKKRIGLWYGCIPIGWGGWQSRGQRLNARDPDRVGKRWRVRCLSEEVVRERAEERTCGKRVIWVSSPVLAWGSSLLSSGLVCLILVITHTQGLHTSGNMPASPGAFLRVRTIPIPCPGFFLP